MNIEEIREYVKTVNLGDYDLGGVEITEEDLEEIKTLVGDGKTLKEATDNVLYGIRKTLDEGLEEE